MHGRAPESSVAQTMEWLRPVSSHPAPGFYASQCRQGLLKDRDHNISSDDGMLHTCVAKVLTFLTFPTGFPKTFGTCALYRLQWVKPQVHERVTPLDVVEIL